MARNDLTLNAEKSQAIIFQRSKHRVRLRYHTPGICDFIGFFNNLVKLFLVTA